MNTTEMMVICREVDRTTGEIAVYRIETEVTESLIFKLKLRARLNPELQYFVTTKAHYEGFGDKAEQREQRKTNTEFVERLVAVEASTKQAHKRIDTLERAHEE